MSLSYDWDEVFGWIGHDGGYDCSPAGALEYLPRCLYSPLVMNRMTQYLTQIKVLGWSLVHRETMYAYGGLFRGKDFVRSDWPPGLWGRFGRLR